MMKFFKKLWDSNPLHVILIGAFLIRLLSAIFSQGYGMHDDHFLVLEASQSWVDGTDYNDWLPKSQVNPVPSGHSFFYVGIHYLILSAFKAASIHNPKVMAFLIRLLHALFSLIVVAFGYKIADRMGGRKAAIQVGLALSFLWFMPMLSVRNLVEMVCIPFLMMGVYMVYVALEESRSYKYFLFAGLVIGLAFSIRFQTAIFIGGVGLVILFRKKFWEAIVFGVGVVISIFMIQGVVDMFIWGRPFAELMEYIRYNLAHKTDYGTDNPYMYASIIIGVLLPPLGWLWIVGFFRSWKKTLIIVLPTLLFTAFHSYFPNKQERFIFPVLPFFVTAGIIGWYKIKESKFWVNHPGLIKGLSVAFWVINIALLLPISVSSSKLSRVNAMYYLYGKSVPHGILIEDTLHDNVNLLPGFYAGSWFVQYNLARVSGKDTSAALVHKLIEDGHYRKMIRSVHYFDTFSVAQLPEYVFICESKDLELRKKAIEQVFPPLKLEAVVEPSILDRILYKQSKSNRNQTIYIYKVLK